MRNLLGGVFLLAMVSPVVGDPAGSSDDPSVRGRTPFGRGTETPDDLAGVYDVKYAETSTGCSPVSFNRGQLTITLFPKKNSLAVNIETIPELAGVPQKGGKVNARTTRIVATTVLGLDANYSVAGKLDDGGVLHVVLVAEYVKHADRKAYCTQSWSVTGLKATPEKKK